ncbi:Ubiquinol oxidase subunit 1 [Bacillus cereus Rock3-28]|nr:Ubiquinol oxidase subunit 1 [Bacillus cereus Rock3-28]
MRTPQHEADADAGVHLDRPGDQRADRRCLPGADHHPGAADPGPLLGYALLHQ